MLELTKEQRRAAYMWGIEWYEARKSVVGALNNPYICNLMIQWMFGEKSTTMHSTDITVHHIPDILKLFPEITAFKPADVGDKPQPWFDNDMVGNLRRKLLLTKALNKLDEPVDDLLG